MVSPHSCETLTWSGCFMYPYDWIHSLSWLSTKLGAADVFVHIRKNMANIISIESCNVIACRLLRLIPHSFPPPPRHQPSPPQPQHDLFPRTPPGERPPNFPPDPGGTFHTHQSNGDENNPPLTLHPQVCVTRHERLYTMGYGHYIAVMSDPVYVLLCLCAIQPHAPSRIGRQLPTSKVENWAAESREKPARIAEESRHPCLLVSPAHHPSLLQLTLLKPAQTSLVTGRATFHWLHFSPL